MCFLETATEFPYQVDWQPVSSGTFEITARATEVGIPVGPTSPLVSVTVNASETPGSTDGVPFIEILTPVTQSEVLRGSEVLLTSRVAAARGNALSVEYFDGDDSIGVTNAPPYSVTWTPKAVGISNISARVIESGVSQAGFSFAQIRVVASDPLIAEFATLSSGDVIFSGRPINLRTRLTNSVGAVTVEYFVNGVSLGQSSDVPFDLEYIPSSAGEFVFYTLVEDQSGARATSEAVTVTVEPDLGPLVVFLSPSPAENSFELGERVPIIVDVFDREGSVSLVQIFANGVLLEEFTEPPYGADYTAAGVGTAILEAVAVDEVGNLGERVFLSVDITAPEVEILDPLSNNQDFVKQGYIDLFGVEASDNVVSLFSAQLDSGEASRSDVIISLINLAEFPGIVERHVLYKTITDVWPSPPQLASAIADLEENEGEIPAITDDHGDTLSTATRISTNEGVSGNITPTDVFEPDDIDTFEFRLNSANTITVRLLTAAFLNVSVQDANNNVFASGILGPAGFIFGTDLVATGLPAPGVFYVQVTGSAFLSDSGPYQLTVFAPGESGGGLSFEADQDQILIELATNLLERDDYIAFYGDLVSASLESVDYDVLEDAVQRHYEFRYGKSPSASQTAQGVLRINGLQGLRSFLVSFASADRNDLQPLLVDLPDTSNPETLATLMSLLFRESVSEDEVLELSSLSQNEAIDRILSDVRYTSRFESVAVDVGSVDATTETLGISGWALSDSLGGVFWFRRPWYYSTDFGWLYNDEGPSNLSWYYSERLGWVWFSEEFDPYIWSSRLQAWLYVYKGENSSFYYDFTSGDWSLLNQRD